MDKKAFSLLMYISNGSKEGEFVVFEKEELIACIPEFNGSTKEEFDSTVKYLELKKYIEIKISDSNNLCVKPTSDGIIFAEIENKHANKTPSALAQDLSVQISYKKIFIFSFLGALLGGLIASVVFIIINHFFSI